MCKSAVDTSTMQCQCDKGKTPVDSLVKPDFPVCQTGKVIPWSIAERAYEGYVKRYGKCQTLERIAERGGFYTEELDQLYPAWREEVEEIYLLRKEVERLQLLIPYFGDGSCDRCSAAPAIKIALCAGCRDEIGLSV